MSDFVEVVSQAAARWPWVFTLIATVASYLLATMVEIFLPKLGKVAAVLLIISLACAIATGAILGQWIGGFGGFVVWGSINLLFGGIEFSSARQKRIAGFFSSKNARDRLWAVSNIEWVHGGFALIKQAALKDPNSQIREIAIRRLAGRAHTDRFVEALETLKSAAADPNEKVGSVALKLFRQLGGDLFSEKWRAVYSRIEANKKGGYSTRLTLISPLSALQQDRRFHLITVPPICCLCGLYTGTEKSVRSWEFSKVSKSWEYDKLIESVELTLGYCKLCTNAKSYFEEPINIEDAKVEGQTLTAKLTFLNSSVAEEFRTVNEHLYQR